MGQTKSDCWQLEEYNKTRLKDTRRRNAQHRNAAISSGTGDEDSDAELLMCAVYYEEEGANEKDIAVLYDEHEYNEYDTFYFVSESEEEENEGSMMSFEDADYPLPDEDLSEIALCAIRFSSSMKLMLDTNVWIADTGTIVHATPNSSALIKKSEINGSDSVTMGNGKSDATEWYGD
jgi:hypothetical protein